MKYFIQYVIPGLLCILMAFIAGSQSNTVLGLFSFLAFFVVGVALMIEGRKRG